ncbi:multiheme c-type cytochrome [Sulfurimonas sp.]|uniref:multiheme c-type cytochrome n=1 Tax=Sulfurimonas sp. TaxID=2022749 RepID=UPI0025F5E7E6|nr:multiheme c-type cytochrome [Sulfurimonas sp.]MDD5156470.1 multiheme c-type cytochrome [Sulfurimonas sp.]
MKISGIKMSILFMFISGVLQMDLVKLNWNYFTTIQVIHAIGAIIITTFLLIPLVYRHIRYWGSIRRAGFVDGVVLAISLFLITISGVYLFLVGNRGGDFLGTYSFYVHLYGSFVLLALLFYHINLQRAKLQLFTLFFALSLFVPAPTYAQDKLSLLKVNGSHSEDWTNSTKCKSCHNEIFNQWADSNHNHMAGSNPYYMAMETLAGEDQGVEFRKWCMGCHNPSGLTTGLEKSTHAMDGNVLRSELFLGGAQSLKNDFASHGNFRLEEGVSCVACHRITDANSTGNGSYSVDLKNRKRYVMEDSKSDIGRWFGEKFINSKPKEHKDSYSNPLYKQSRYCASCHNEFHPKTAIKIVSTYEQWEKSSFNNPKDKTKHKSCIDCHMSNLKDGKFSPLKGASTDGGVVKNSVKTHYFAGSNHFLIGLKNKTAEAQTLQLLKTSAKMDVDVKDGKLIVGIKNVGAGHNLPTGVADLRELWLDITLRDADGKVVLSSGKLKSDGNIEDNSRIFMKVFGDDENKPVGLMFWRYTKLLSDTTIPAGERRVESYNIKTELKYPLKVTVKLNFRIYPQWVSDVVKKMYPQLPNPLVVELQKIERVLSR